jgi:hypothetical protein
VGRDVPPGGVATLIQDAGTPSIDEARPLPASPITRRRSSPVQERLSRHVR